MPIIVDFPTVLDPATGLDLCHVYLNAADNPADFCAFAYVGESIGITYDPRASVRQLINRRRVVRTGAKVYAQIGLELLWVTPEQRLWLAEHVSQVVCVRDHVGTKVYAAYMSLPVEVSTTPLPVPYLSSSRLTLDEISFSEAV